MGRITNIDVGTVQVSTSDIKLTNYYTVDTFISKVENSCRSVLCEVSLLKQKYPELEDELTYFGVELHELLNIIETEGI